VKGFLQERLDRRGGRSVVQIGRPLFVWVVRRDVDFGLLHSCGARTRITMQYLTLGAPGLGRTFGGVEGWGISAGGCDPSKKKNS
jgi:hypothetical protein